MFAIICILFGVYNAYRRHGAQVFPAMVGRGGVVDRAPTHFGDDTANEGYNPWGKTSTDPVTRQVVAPKVLVRDSTGQFHVNVMVNGRDTRFLVDTGADVVALTPQTAADLRLPVDERDYRPVLRTASGTGMGAVVMLDSVEVAGRRLDHQRAVVAQGLDENLLGQSVLRSIGKVELKGDTMVLMPN